MLKGLAIAILALVLACAAAFAIFVMRTRTVPSGAGSRLDQQNFTQIQRGRYLTIVADCAGCHSGPGKPFAGGRPVPTPFGAMIAPNVTPDRETGIGAWSDDEFVAALRDGKRPDGAPLYPAMPYPSYTKLTKDDALAIRAYLNTVTPIRNAVVANTLPFPFNIREAMLIWDRLYFKRGEFRPDKSKSADWNRGAYLVEGPGHCGACHTPKTLLGGDLSDQALQGYTLQGWFASNITNDEQHGLGRWGKPDIVAYLESGHNAISAATGTMAEEISLSSSHWTDADLDAVATYLKDMAPVNAAGTPLDASTPVMKAGGAIYADVCSACHGPDGKGAPNLFPALADSANVRSNDAASLIRITLEGARSVATPKEPTAPAMPAFGWQLSDDQIAAVLTYIRNSWGGAAPAVSKDAVSHARATLPAVVN
jgi:mono/diheme cytochrome c family protein